jgi:hypothetical protein
MRSAAERDAAAKLAPSPVAALIRDITEMPIAARPDQPIAAHLVLGWDEGCDSVTDFGWDYLPRLSYAIRDPATSEYTFYEERSGLLYGIDRTRAGALRLLDAEGRPMPNGKPRITSCLSVRTYIAGYVEADCIFDSGASDRLVVAAAQDAPMDVERY